jgi:hypothetical protein
MIAHTCELRGGVWVERDVRLRMLQMLQKEKNVLTARDRGDY